VRVARILTRPNVGGPTKQAVALWHAHRAQGTETLLVCGVCAPDEAAVDLTAAGIPVLTEHDVRTGRPGAIQVPDLARRVSPLRDFAAVRATRRILDAWRPDVVHTHTSKAGIVGCMAARTPLVHTFHGLVVRDYAGRVGSALATRAERWAGRRRDAALAVSNSCRAELAELGIAANAEVVLPAVSVDGDESPTSRIAELPERRAGAPAIGFIGRLVPIKRPEWFVDLASAFPEVDAYIVGKGPLERALRRVAPDNLHFLGAADDVRPALEHLDLLVLPSRREGFPVVSVEAASRRVPTLGFAVPGLVDLARYGGIATLAPPASGFDGLAAGLRWFLGDRPRVADEDAARLVSDCAPSRIASQLSAVYERCVRASVAMGKT
jgi:glycosyltransferase involved in cell wall biosynthesis